MTPVLAHEAEVEFELGGPAYRLMQRIGLIKGAGPSVGRRVVAFLSITWVPLLVLAVIEDRALGPTPQQSLLLDFATYARFFLAVPLLFVAELITGPRLRAVGLHFVQGDFVRPEDLPAVEAAIVRVSRRREALLPELIMLGIALWGAWYFTVDTLTGGTATATWRSAQGPGGMGLTLAGFWYQFIAVPILQFFMYRWLWRLLIWTLFLRELSRLELKLVPTHPDRAGGLGLLGAAHVSLAIFPFAFSCVLSGHIAFQVYFEAVPIETFKILFAAYLVLMELICFGPLLIFAPLLSRTRRMGMRRYSILANTYNRAFDQKWVTDQSISNESLLGSADIQSLADLGNSFAMIREMRLFPFSQQQILQIAVITSLPGLPLIFLVMPVGEVLKLLAGALL